MFIGRFFKSEMTILPALAAAFAAFCVWLTVRISNRREKPGLGFWATVVVAVVVGAALFFLFTAPWLYVGHTSW
jgi:ABC-type branched-subunit amino acid transport system permease subunit